MEKTMTLVELVTSDFGRAWVNPEAVISVQPHEVEEGVTVIALQGQQSLLVRAEVAEAATALAAAGQG
jgi:hypothetical protein